MALSPQLLNFKSSGVYRLEFDKSQTANIDVETLRLVVGSSRKGPYNTPVLIDSQETFNNVFGSIDKGLEKKGMFFHRSCLEALSRGPILALNLGKFTDGTNGTSNDVASFASLATNGRVDGNFAVDGSEAYDSFFDNDKFMTPSDSSTLTAVGNGENNLLNFVNIKQDAITIIVRQAQDVAEFNSTARDWYGVGNIPEYLNESDRLSDFMVDVFVFKGEFDADKMKNDPIYSEFFTAEGLDKSKLNEFANLRQVSLIAQYTGSVLPGFKDLEGRNLYIESIVNAEARRTGLFCAIDEDRVIDEDGTKIDLVGHVYEKDQDYELLSHVAGQIEEVEHTLVTEGTNSLDATKKILKIDGVTPSVRDDAYTATQDGIPHYLLAASSGEFVEVTNVSAFTATTTPADTTVSLSGMTGNTLAVADTITIPGVDLTASLAGTFYLESTSGAGIEPYLPATASYVGSDTVIFASNSDDLTHFDALTTSDSITIWDEEKTIGEFEITCDDAIDVALETATNIDLYHVSNNRVLIHDFAQPSNGEGDVVLLGSGNTGFTVTYNLTGQSSSNIPETFPISIGDYVDSATTDRLARVNRISKELLPTDPAILTKTHVRYTVFTDIVPAYGDYIIKSFENSSNYYKTFVLPKASIGVKEISEYLSVLTGGNGLYDALIDKDIIDFRYVVDTYTSFDKNGLNTKSNLSQLAKDRQNASAILNAPTIADFKSSTDPSFTDSNLSFDTAYIATGGNQDKNPTKVYSLPSIAAGANYAFYYGPGLIVSDNGKDIIVPPAAYVSNNYLDKYTNALPWSIVAGPRRGVVSGTNVKGVEYSFDKNDRDILEPFGINPIVFQRGVGLTILGNKTAQQSIKSALSSAHVREVLIYIQDGMANILKDYVFEFNTVQTRLEIKTLADAFLEGVKQDGGVFEFKNVMDSTNNTNEVIDNNIGIIDTYVEPVKGLEIVVHRTTVLNTGEIQSGNLG